MRLGILIALLLWPLASQARTSQISLPTTKLLKQALAHPNSFVFLDLSGIDRDMLKLNCPIEPLNIVPNRKKNAATAYRTSRTLQFEYTSQGPMLYECNKGLSCAPLLAQNPLQPLQLSGDEFIYNIGLNMETFSAVAKRAPKCSSAHIHLIERNSGRLEVPGSLWVLEYGQHIALWNPVHENVWFTIQLPGKATLGALKTVEVDSHLRMVYRGLNGSFLVLDWRNDFALFKDQKGMVWNTQWGAGSAAYRDEWISEQRNSSTQQLDSPDLLTVGTAGVALANAFYPWEHFKSHDSRDEEFFQLPGRVISASTSNTHGYSTEVEFVIDNGNTLQLMRWSSSSKKLFSLTTKLRRDSRAKDEHFISAAGSLYRLTSDGFYEVGQMSEKPAALKALKSSVESFGSVFITRERKKQSCTLNLWSNPDSDSRSFKPRFSKKACYKHPGLGITPGSLSISGVNGKVFETEVWNRD